MGERLVREKLQDIEVLGLMSLCWVDVDLFGSDEGQNYGKGRGHRNLRRDCARDERCC